MLVKPHGGGRLMPLLVSPKIQEEEKKRANSMTRVPLTSRELSDLLMLAMGAYTPLTGFMGEEDWRSCCKDMSLENGLFWPIPITLSTTKDISNSISIGDEVVLVNSEDKLFGTLVVEQKYKIDKVFETKNVFHTDDDKHPGVSKVLEQGEINLSGPVKVFDEDHYPKTYKGLYFKPEETRALFEKNGWSSVAAFQTRNPMHRSHEYLAKIAVELCDGLLIHQVLGALKPGDIPAGVRVKAIDSLVKNYFVPGTVVQAGYPIEMRYGGPREALLHAVFRQNFGCSHLVVGRDHAGVGNYYGPFDAHKIFDEISSEDLKTQAIKIDITFYCYKCNGMATGRTCPHNESDRLNVSGTRLREMLINNETVPLEFSRPEVLEILQGYYYTER